MLTKAFTNGVFIHGVDSSKTACIKIASLYGILKMYFVKGNSQFCKELNPDNIIS